MVGLKTSGALGLKPFCKEKVWIFSKKWSFFFTIGHSKKALQFFSGVT